jgi:phage terminase small subunit
MAAKRNAKGLTPIDERFVAEYLIDLNGTRAYLASHPKCKSERAAAVGGSKTLTRPNVAAAVAEGQRRKLASKELSATRVLEELRRLAFLDVGDLFDADGHLLALNKMPAEARAAIAGLEVARANFDRTDGKRSDEWLHKIKLAPKDRALEMLAKHFKLLTDVVKVEGDWDKLAARLSSARQRVGGATGG